VDGINRGGAGVAVRRFGATPAAVPRLRAHSNIDQTGIPAELLDPTLPARRARRSVPLIGPTRRNILRLSGKIVA